MEDSLNITVSKINDYKVTPLNGGKQEKPALGHDLFPVCFSNIFLCAKKKSGKTTVIKNILEECTSPKSIVYIFSSTYHVDKSWRKISKMLDQMGVKYHVYTELFEPGRDPLTFKSIKVNRIDKIVNELTKAYGEEDKKDDVPRGKHIRLMTPEQIDAKMARRDSKYTYPEHIFVLDDISDILKNKTLTTFLKKNRHFRSKVILSSQYYKDLLPESRQQLDYVIAFGKIGDNILKKMHEESGFDYIPFKAFKRLYEHMTHAKYHFMYLDREDMKVRRDFNTEIEIQSDSDSD